MKMKGKRRCSTCEQKIFNGKTGLLYKIRINSQRLDNV